MKVLVATDGPRSSAAAIRFAGDVASASRGRMIVVTVGEVSPRLVQRDVDPGALTSFERLERRSALVALERARRDTGRVAPSVRYDYLAPRPTEPFAETISRAAYRAGAELVVVGTGGGRPVSRWLFGSVSNRLMYVARIPVAVVKAGAKRTTGRPTRILVATDGSRAAESAVRFAARLASEVPRARLVVLTVSTLTADLSLTPPGFARALGLLPELEHADRRAAMGILAKAAKQARLGRRATLRYYRPKRRLFAARAILEEARRQRADVIVLGRTGRSAFGDVLMGSVAQRVVTLAKPPVILVPRSRGLPKPKR